MDQYRTQRASYTTQDFLGWNTTGELEITPKFQRRGVWKQSAKAFFIDTILRGMTVPPIYLRMTDNPENTGLIRQIVDGQQRIRAILSFIDGEFKLAKPKEAANLPPWAGKTFDQLTRDEKKTIKTYSFTTETFLGISDKEILEVFCRLNMNGVGLNGQELRSGRFFGEFKTTSYGLALTYLQFWRNHGIFSEIGIARMLEVELTSELLIAAKDGMQDKKTSIDDYYKEWDEVFPESKNELRKFNETMASISETFGTSEISNTAFKRPPLFYTLYCVVFHRLFGLPKISRQSPKRSLTKDQRSSLLDAVIVLSEKLADAKDPASEIPARYKSFIHACSRQTDNIQPRKQRFDSLYDEAF